MSRTIACVLALASIAAAPAIDPLAGLVLEDESGHARHLEELTDTPVLLVIADRRASEQANGWGERLAAGSAALTPWRATGKVAWLSIVDGRGVPEFARDAARERIREREVDAARKHRTSMLLDWTGLLAERLGAERGRALIVLLSRDHVPFARAGGAPTDDAVERMIDAISGVAAP